MEQRTDYILEAANITKRFSGVVALDGVQLKVERGTVHAVMGENGAGKSTLMKVILGLYKADEGEIRFKGQQVKFSSPQEALKSGIAMIHQELSSVLDRTIAQNMFLNREITFAHTPFLNQKAMNAETERILQRLGVQLRPDTPMKKLTAAQQQLCEIAKAVSFNAEMIIMDEPTSSLSDNDVETLFGIIGQLRRDGITIIYISHKLDEIFRVCDNVSVYRDGMHIQTVKVADITQDDLISMMVGREIKNLYPPRSAQIGEVVMKVDRLSHKKYFKNASFELRKGEILGFAGLVGAGRSEVMETVYGIRKKSGGEVYVRGERVSIKNPYNAIAYHIGFLTEDRKRSGCFLCLNVLRNIYIAAIDRFTKLGFLNHKRIRAESLAMSQTMNIKMAGMGQRISALSGGNQQKCLIARWLLIQPDILIVDEPTRGIDVGSKAMIHKLLRELADRGTGIIMVSSEMPEILGLSDRIVVMHEGDIMGMVNAEDANQELLMSLASGIPQGA